MRRGGQLSIRKLPLPFVRFGRLSELRSVEAVASFNTLPIIWLPPPLREMGSLDERLGDVDVTLRIEVNGAEQVLAEVAAHELGLRSLSGL